MAVMYESAAYPSLSMDFRASPSKYCHSCNNFMVGLTGAESTHAVNVAFHCLKVRLSPLKTGIVTRLILINTSPVVCLAVGGGGPYVYVFAVGPGFQKFCWLMTLGGGGPG